MKEGNFSNFLIVKTSAIGDVLQSLAVVQYLKFHFPKSRVDWIVEENLFELLKAYPLIDRVISIKSKEWKKKPFSKGTLNEVKNSLKLLKECTYDLLFDLQGNCKSGLISILARAKKKIGYSFRVVAEKPNILATNLRFYVEPQVNARARYLSLVQNYFADREPFLFQPFKFNLKELEKKRLAEITSSFKEKTIMVIFGSNWPNKRLHLIILKHFLAKINACFLPQFIFIFGNEEEKALAIELQALFYQSQIIGDLSLALWQALMYRVRGIIATDSAGLHLCGTTTTPSFSLFGPSSAHFYNPNRTTDLAFQGSCPYKINFIKRCPKLKSCKSGACLKNLDEEKLFKSFLGWAKQNAL